MNMLEAAADAWRTGRKAAFATVIEAAGSTPRTSGARMLVYADGSSIGTIGGGALEQAVIARARDAIRTGRPERYAVHVVRDLGMCCGGRVEVYVEPLFVRVPFVMFGAGHVAHALAPILAALEFDVTVVDDRPELLDEERFPGCERVVGDAIGFARSLQGHPDAHWLVVTHDHQLDQELLEILLAKTSAWLGMIGSRGKVGRFLARLEAAGVDPSLFRKLCAPVGLDIGAETPAEIAVAIAAELVRVRRGADRVPMPLSALPLPARGGDGTAKAAAFERSGLPRR